MIGEKPPPAPQVMRRSLLPLACLGLLLGAAQAVAAASQAVQDGQCDAAGGNCPNSAATLAAGKTEAAVDASLPVADGANSTATEGLSVQKELGMTRIIILFSMLFGVGGWILATIKWSIDGSLPARLALWGLLPEAYAAISVSAVVSLLRMKSGTTPVIVLKNCVTDAGALELAEALRKYGKKADVQAIELPHNPALTTEGLKALAAFASEEGSNLQEVDLSFNHQLGDSAVEILAPLLAPKASKLNTLRLMDCNLSADAVRRLAEGASRSRLRLLDLSGNKLRGAGEVLAELCDAPVLEELVLTCCGLTPDDVGTLAEQLPYTSIRSLRLGGNRFGSAGVVALAKHLAASQVDELELEQNDVGSDCLGALGTAWAKRPFSRIRLSGNRLSQAEMSSFVRTLRSMQA